MEDTHPHLFSPSMKLADIVLANHSLLPVLVRMGIDLGFGEKSLAEVCRNHSVDHQLLLVVANVYTFSDYLPDQQTISGIDHRSLVHYLRGSHTYYREHTIAQIESLLANLCESCVPTHAQILDRFFSEYKRELFRHFQYEEGTVFPYIDSLLGGKSADGFTITQYQENHSNIEDKISDLKSILIKYLPPSCSTGLRVEILDKIFHFEEDISMHSLIEDRVLIPYVSQIEEGLKH